MDYVFTDGRDEDFNELCALLDASLDQLAGHIIDRSKLIQYNTTEKISDVILVYDGGVPVACGGIRLYEEGVAEIKRVFVRETHRGQGISKQLMALLEKRAAEKGYRALILETGAPLTAAIGLYTSLGYHIIANYEPYVDKPHCICMRKELPVQESVKVREAAEDDLVGILTLYRQFKSTPIAETDANAAKIWRAMMTDSNHHIVVLDHAGQIVSTCVIIIVPNLTHGGRPYALVENVITDEQYRGKGYASAVLNFARGIAVRENCYKIMLMTGSKLDSTLQFYERAGYNRHGKTAFIQWLL